MVGQFVGLGPPVKPGIRPIDFAKELKPVWIEFSDVPPELLYPKGMSWLASQFGKPINRFVRQGFTVKACVLREDNPLERKELVIDMKGIEPAVVQVGFPVFRGMDASRGKTRSQQFYVAARGKSSGNVSESSSEEKGAPEEASGMPAGGGVGNFSEPSEEGEEEPTQQGEAEALGAEVVTLSPEVSTSGKKRKKKNRKGKGGADYAGSQQSPSAAVNTSSGNGIETSLEGTDSPECMNSKLVGGGLANEAESSLQEEVSANQQGGAEALVEVCPLSPVKPARSEKGVTYQSAVEQFGPRRMVTFGEFTESIMSPVKSNVLTRQQHNKQRKK
ncbi:hypothetical protein LINPERPRIM_LOCUS37722 [Linum perenne]